MKLPMRANTITTVLASVITASGTAFTGHVIRLVSGKAAFFITIVSGAIVFVIPFFILVLGLPYIKDSTVYRVKHFSFRIFIFPSNQDDFYALTRILIYFFITVSILLLLDWM